MIIREGKINKKEVGMINERDRRIALKTGALYASIWDEFSPEQWEQFSDDHFFKWMHIPLPKGYFRGKICLDAERSAFGVP